MLILIESCIFLEEDITFIYPDMSTVLKGKFKDGVMIEARRSKVIAERCNDGIKEILVSSPKSDSPVFSFKRNNKFRVYEPTIMDPMEKNTVYVKTTELKGDGLFARRDIEPFELVAYYSGVVVPADGLKESRRFNLTDNERCYFVSHITYFIKLY